jgi:hypothetical protein
MVLHALGFKLEDAVLEVVSVRNLSEEPPLLMFCPGCPVSFVHLVKALYTRSTAIDYASLYRLVWMSLFIFMLFFICELAAISSFAKRATPLLAKALLAFP